MKPRFASTIPEPTETEIQHAAYLLWLESGQTPGRDLEHWFAAKELLRHRHARSCHRSRRGGFAHAATSPAHN
jgi:hypothetical protein